MIGATVPGELISDLAAAGRIPPPFLDLTWREHAGLWDLDTWTYETTFAPPPRCPNGDGTTWLVFEAVKMAATVSVNGAFVGNVTNQVSGIISIL